MKQLITKDTFLPDHKADSGKTNKLLVDDTGELISVEDTGGGGGSGGIEFVSTENTSDIEHSGNGTASSKLKSVISTSVKNNIQKGVTAQSWGNHANAGYLTQHQDISGKEDKANKVTNLLNPNNATYPTTLAIINAINDLGFVFEAPNDGKTYGRKNEAWEEVIQGGGGSYNAGTKAQLDTGTNTESRVWAAKTLADWLAGKGYITSYNDTTYSAGLGLTLSGTTFSLPVTISGTGTYVQSVVQTENGITVTLGTPPNTTYSAGTQALLAAGTNTSNRVWSAKVLSDWINDAIVSLGIISHVNVKTSNFTLSNDDHMKTLVVSNNTITINPTQNYRISFQVSFKNDHETLPTTINIEPLSGWSFRVNDDPTFTIKKSFRLAVGGTFTLIRKEGQNKLLLDGDLEEITNS